MWWEKRVKQQKAKTKRQIFNDSLSSRKDLLLNDFSCMMKLRGVLVNHREWDHRERYIRQAAQNVRQHILCNLSTIRVPRNLFKYKPSEFNCISRLFYSPHYNTLLLALHNSFILAQMNNAILLVNIHYIFPLEMFCLSSLVYDDLHAISTCTLEKDFTYHPM